ncbi:hypothetical [Yersinia pestis KIM10+]|uniref:Uncharacterized protein n=1 Tax=Yersinia pestis TaxID=632 RepID=Q8CKD0_YERPE|nr:hypothetical [Yersinia pestis KIM10+]
MGPPFDFLLNICSCQTANCFNKSKGVFITDPKLKALLNPQPSWGFSGHNKKAATKGCFRLLTKSIEGETCRWGRSGVSHRSAPRCGQPFIHEAKNSIINNLKQPQRAAFVSKYILSKHLSDRQRNT